MTALRIHKTQANVFYKHISDKREGLKMCALIISKTRPCQRFLTKLHTTHTADNFTCITLLLMTRIDSALTQDNVFIYTWKENDFAKNSSSCAGAMFHALRNIHMAGVECVRLVSDACCGQNKNSL
ncbi:hypothetical protein PoB_002850800 [Plakobranchus ocellatus]|uniref:Uncharacterized protein n=1 Tax=Plakobranchus ocellatus TaxID=259542 RepID=A0AAV4A491_9GAST|nr:hypothetical protein PoB_002850800 [Plakobranchus ocellatus]